MSPLVLILQLMLMARPGARLASSWVFVAGNLLVLLSLALRAMRMILSAVPREPARPPGRHPLLGAFGLGLGTMGANVTTFVLYLPAAQEVGRAAFRPGLELLAYALLALITLLPAWAPPALVMATGAAGRRQLGAVA